MEVSVIIPARNEKYLQATLDSLYANAGMEIEVVVILDGPTQYPLTKDYPNLIVVENNKPRGIREAIRRGFSDSHGDLVLKLDAHCIVGPNFVSTLSRDIRENWVMVARRYTLNLETMTPQPRAVDYYYLSCPWTHPSHFMMQSCPWITETEDFTNLLIDDLMCFQGSMWMMPRTHWYRIDGLFDNGETFVEHHEISMKTWDRGGRVAIDKNVWYAHPSRITGGYRMDMNTVYKDHAHSAEFWTGNRSFFEGLIDRFWPLPTEQYHHRLEKYVWPEDWKERFYVD